VRPVRARRLAPLRFVAIPVALAALAAGTALGGGDGYMHPPIRLLDADGASVLEADTPVSPLRTCGECHDTSYIKTQSYHACVGLPELTEPGEAPSGRPWDTSPGMFGRWNPITYRVLTPLDWSPLDLGTAEWISRFGYRHIGSGPATRSRRKDPATGVNAWLEDGEPGEGNDPETHVLDPASGTPEPFYFDASGTVEMDCFLCHIAAPGFEARRTALAEGRFRWASTATLSSTGLSVPTGHGYRWNRDAFGEGGTVGPDRLRITDPRSANCGNCHGAVHEGPEPLTLAYGRLSDWSTETKGQVFSAQRISHSGLNLAGKRDLDRPWDAHAERLFRCSFCHHSLNHPGYYLEFDETKPRHLRFDARKLEVGSYLKRPSHHFAKGFSVQGYVSPALDGTMRRCDSCHDPAVGHEWLPNREWHFRALLCETCHVPDMKAPARRQTDWTVLTRERTARVEYRGADGPVNDPATLYTGYVPVLLPRREPDGSSRIGPMNLMTSWFWVCGEPERPVRLYDLEQAFFDGPDYSPGIVSALDEDGNGSIEEAELRLDTPEKVEAVRLALLAVGVRSPRIRGEIQPAGLHHNVVTGTWVIRDCGACHGGESRLARSFALASYVPGGVVPEPVGDTSARLAGRMVIAGDGSLALVTEPAAAGVYVLGSSRVPWIDIVGGAFVILTILGVLAHGGLRILSAPGRKREVAP